MRRRTIVWVIAVAVAVVVLFGWRAVAVGGGTTFSASFESAVGLYPGSDVQILGVPVGTVTKVRAGHDGVRVTMHLDRGQDASAETAAVIVAPTLVSDRFVQLTKPYVGGARLAEGTRLPRERTAVPVEIDQLYESLTDVSEKLGPNGINANGALSDFLDTAARNLDGQGAGINQMIDEFGKASATLSKSGDDLFETFASFKEFNDMLVANDAQVAKVNKQFATVTDYLAEDRGELASAIDHLGSALAVVDDFIEDNREHLTSSVKGLVGPTQVLVRQKKSLEESVRTFPLVLQNFLKAYNPETNTIDGRGNLNDISIWGGAR